ncbi:MAG: phosphate transport system regulatory protein PhoU [Planctomycetota bacterium]|nr:MAG: phosphate transport system regulatory protein PhoU [Planctomycetota bacterium]
MAELQERLEKLILRLDLMGMRVEQALADAIHAIKNNDVEAGKEVNLRDSAIDREEVEIEQECIRLLALYQPAAIDLRTICTIIKVNSDLERIADLAAGIGRRVKHVVENQVDFECHSDLDHLFVITTDILGRTVRTLKAVSASTARKIIEADDEIDNQYRQFVSGVLANQDRSAETVETALTLINTAKAMERIGDLCTNIAEDIIFLKTGDIVRHAEAMKDNPQD